MKKIIFASFLLGFAFNSKAQTLILTNSTTPTASTTLAGGNSLLLGSGAGNNVTNAAGQNAFVGTNAGMSNTSGADNTFVGWGVGPVNTTGAYNTFVGRSAGNSNTTGFYNSFFGSLAGHDNTTGTGNTFNGFGAGKSNVAGGNNVITGWSAGATLNSWGNSIYGTYAGKDATGDGNTLLGQNAGYKAGSLNVMIGNSAGYNETGSSKLYIDNSDTTTPLIWGDLANDQLKFHGKVGIGGNGTTAFGSFPTTAGTVNVSAYNLFVKGGILTEEVRVNLTSGWADYVFAKDYELKPLAEVESYIAANGHLPNVPSAKQVKEEGIELGEMSKIQQEKIEELPFI